MIETDNRLYMIRNRDGEYFSEWESTGWETVKGFAVWTRIKEKALRSSLSDLPKYGYMDLVCGFAGLTLERVRPVESRRRL
jgi:hypothetical protein